MLEHAGLAVRMVGDTVHVKPLTCDWIHTISCRYSGRTLQNTALDNAQFRD